MLEHPVLGESFREKERMRCRMYRAEQGEEQKKKSNEKARLRMQKYRQRKKEQAETECKPKTRKNAENEEEQRAKKREAKRREREKMTPQKRMWINKKRRDKRAAEKAAKEAAKKAAVQRTTDTQTANTELEMDQRTAVAKRQALHRAKTAMPKGPDQYAATLEDLHSKASPRKKAALERRGLNIEKGRVGLFMLDAVKNLRNKNDLKSRKTRKVILRMFEKYGSLSKRSKALKMNRLTIARHHKLKEDIKTTREKKSEETKKQIASFFAQKAVPLPNKKTVSKVSGVATSLLEKPLADYYAEYKDSGGCASLSHFAKCRPKEVRKMAATPLNQCLCEYCENSKLKIRVLNNIPSNACRIRHVYHAVQLSICENGGKSCAYRRCPDCDIDKLEQHLEPLKGYRGQLTWHRWTTKQIQKAGNTVSRKVLETRKGGITDILQEFLAEIAFLSEHLFRADWQHKQFENLRNLRPFPNNFVMMVLDFAENFTCLYQHEVQAAHWHHEQVTIHPVSCYYRCPFGCEESVNESLIFVSDDLLHDFHAVHAFTTHTMQHLREVRGLHLEKVVQWSDGCAAQYKSKGPFGDVAASEHDFGVRFQRNFFGSRHGKGPCDGEAAVIKSHATNSVKAGTAVISCAKDLFDYCIQSRLNKQPNKEKCEGHFFRTFYWIPTQSISRPRPDRSFRTVKGTRNFHQVASDGFGMLLARHLSCYCDTCMSGSGDCSLLDIVESWKSHTLIPTNGGHPGIHNPDPVPNAPGPANPCNPCPAPHPEVAHPATVPDPEAANPCPVPDPVPAAVPDPDVAHPAAVPDPDVAHPAAVLDPDVTHPAAVPDPDVAHPAAVPDPDVTYPAAVSDPDVAHPADLDPAPDDVPRQPSAKAEETTYGDIKDRFRTGSWVRAVLRYGCGKKTGEFIGKVLDQDTEMEELEVKFLKRKGTYYTWPQNDDIAWVPVQDVRPVGNPDITARQHFIFD